ncbi:MAG: hypothetical protein WA417_11885 [Stellaceae bacterium]
MVLVTGVENGAGACGGVAIAATGHRRQLLNAISAVSADAGPKSVGQSIDPVATAQAERPGRALKPADATYPPFLGPFPPPQHLTGPWQRIRQWKKDNAQSLRGKSAAAGG